MNLAELIEEGKRLESKQNSVVALPLQWATLNERRPFYIEHGPRLLAVAEAAVEWEAADAEQRRVPAWSRDTDLFERMLFRYQSATRALRAAVRGEGVLND